MTPSSTLATIIVATVTALGGWLASRKPGTRENVLIDQLQEQLTVERGEREKLDGKVDRLYGELAQLRQHVVTLQLTDAAWNSFYTDLHMRWPIHRVADRAPVMTQIPIGIPPEPDPLRSGQTPT